MAVSQSIPLSASRLECDVILERVPQPVWDFRTCAPFIPSYGWIRDYVAYGIQCTDAPPLYHILASLAGVALALSPDHVVTVNGEEHPLHAFFLIVGESGSRKSAAIKRCLRVIEPRLAAAQIGHRIWYPEASTVEGMFDELIKDPARLLVASEWTEYHNQGKASYNQHSKEFVNLLYDGTPLHRLKKGIKLTVERPCVSILGASTPSLIKQSTTLYDWSAGKLARYVIGYMHKPDDVEMVSAVEHPQLVDELRLGYDHLLSASYGKSFVLDQEAWDYKLEWEHSQEWIQFRRGMPEHLLPSGLRVSEHVYRIAALYQASQDYPHSTVVKVEAMSKAIQLLQWCCKSLVETFTILPSSENNIILRVLQALKMHGPAGVTRRDLLRQTHLNGAQLSAAIGALREREEVEIVQDGRRLNYAYRQG
jgi:hypothetical protein